MNNKVTPFTSLILAIWLLLVATAIAFTFTTVKKVESDDYDLMVQAATLAEQCFDEIKRYRTEELSIELSPLDRFETGMIGIEAVDAYDGSFLEYYEHYGNLLCISTTEGELFAKRTSCDPNWAGALISMYRKAGLVSGDEVGMMFSGSFPAMNITALVSAEVYGLKVCAMSGIGASYYGANDPRLPFFQMVEHLVDVGLLTHGLDYLSWGGADDCLIDYAGEYEGSQELENVKKMINDSTLPFIYEKDFDKNIAKRIALYKENVPNIKLFINVGGTLVGFGTGNNVFNPVGYLSANRYDVSNSSVYKLGNGMGLIEYFHHTGIPVVCMLNFKTLSNKYAVPYVNDSVDIVKPEIGLTPYNVNKGYYNFYYESHYNLTVVIIALSVSAILFVTYYFHRKANSTGRKTNERNYILCGR